MRSLRYLNGRTLSPFPAEAGHAIDHPIGRLVVGIYVWVVLFLIVNWAEPPKPTKKGMFFNGVFIAAFLLGLNLLEGLFYRVAETYPSPFFDWLRDQLQSGDYGYSEGPLILLILPVIVVCVGVWVVCAGVASLLRKLRR